MGRSIGGLSLAALLCACGGTGSDAAGSGAPGGDSAGPGADADPSGADSGGRTLDARPRDSDATTGDLGTADATTGDPGAADAVPPPDAALAPPQNAAEWTPFPVPSWRVATVGSQDEVFAFVEEGSFTFPNVGRDFRGVTWSDVVPDENASLGGFPPAVVHAAAVLSVDRDRTLILRADNGIAAYVDGVPQPGDLYGSGRMRVPLALRAGPKVVVVRIIGGRGTPVLQLWETPDVVLHAPVHMHHRERRRWAIPVGTENSASFGASGDADRRHGARDGQSSGRALEPGRGGVHRRTWSTPVGWPAVGSSPARPVCSGRQDHAAIARESGHR